MRARTSGPSGKFKMTHRCNACSALPRDAVRGGSIYLPCCKQVHGHRSVQSPAPGETQPATSLRHGPGCGWGCPTPSWGFQTADQCGSSLCVFVQEVETLHAHGSALWTAADQLISPQVGVVLFVPRRNCSGSSAVVNGPTAELVVPTTLLRVYEGWLVPHRRAEGRGTRSSQWRGVWCGFVCFYSYTINVW